MRQHGSEQTDYMMTCFVLNMYSTALELAIKGA
jgi:hypothetical protein